MRLQILSDLHLEVAPFDAPVTDADLVDAGLIFGAGFAPFRGGPLAWATRIGEAEVVARLERLTASEGARFAPDAGWTKA